MDEKDVKVQKREEGAIIPEGVSCTETESAYYIRVRNGNRKIAIKIPKDNYFNTSYSIDELVEANFKQWYGVKGTNG